MVNIGPMIYSSAEKSSLNIVQQRYPKITWIWVWKTAANSYVLEITNSHFQPKKIIDFQPVISKTQETKKKVRPVHQMFKANFNMYKLLLHNPTLQPQTPTAAANHEFPWISMNFLS